MKQSTDHKTQDQWIITALNTQGLGREGFLGEIKYLLWVNPTNEYSMRLSANGYKWFSRYLTFNSITIAEAILPKQMLQLERLFTAPYCIKQSKMIYVHSEQDFIMLQLHGGDLNRYLDNLQNQ